MLLYFATALVVLGISDGCGVRPYGARVIGGTNASPHSWPWQISLRVRGRHICGGSLIKPDWVLTAAHCVDRNPSPSGYTVVVGAHRRTGTTSVQKTFNLKRLIKHSGFSMRNLKHDIALLQLETPVRLSEKVSTVCLPSKEAMVGARCFITGWGKTVGTSNSLPDVLQQAMLPVASHQDCVKKYGSTLDQRAHLCAGEARHNAAGGCNGDSGGPFVCEEGGRWILHGAVSFGQRDCPTTHYTVFTRLSSYLNWIGRYIPNGPPPPPTTSKPPRPPPPTGCPQPPVTSPQSPPPPQTPPPPPTAATPPSPDCKDIWAPCGKMKQYCVTDFNVKRYCQKTCGVC